MGILASPIFYLSTPLSRPVFMFLILLVWPWLLCQTIQAVLKGMLTENLIGEGSQGPGDYNEFSD